MSPSEEDHTLSSEGDESPFNSGSEDMEFALNSNSSDDEETKKLTSGEVTQSAGEKQEKGVSKADKNGWGITQNGERFYVPRTYEAVELFVDARKWLEFPVLVKLIGIVVAFFSYFFGLPAWCYLFVFMFWRFCYNIGLGVILHKQSNERWFSNLFKNWISNEKNKQWFERNISTKDDIERVFTKRGVKTSTRLYHIDEHPLDYSAWMAYRAIVDIVLANDLFWYLMFAVAYFEVPSSFGIVEILTYIIGILLISFNIWAKSDALRVLGDYAWYWGDFFFLLDKKLIFDGIFQMFPHPMYTVGYSFYYGLSLLTRSYVVLVVSFVAHMLQLSFLIFVENPHIEKTYGTFTDSDPRRDEILSKYFDKRQELILFFNLDIYRASDLFLIILVIYNVLIAFADFSPAFYVAQVIIWRLVHCLGIGSILEAQSTKKSFTNHWIKVLKGSKRSAFENWKKIYNASLTINHVVFVLCAFKLFIYPSDWKFSSYILKMFGGLVLIGLNIWGSMSTYEVLGDFGWFYGDFFIDEIPPKLYYTGIYRYLNNPELVLGFAAYYGLAMISHSWYVCFLAIFCQLSTWALVKYVEKPHMLQKYGHEEVRRQGGIEKVIKSKLKRTLSSPTISKLTKLKIAREIKKFLETIEDAEEKELRSMDQ